MGLAYDDLLKKYFVVEAFTDKGVWEIVGSYNDLIDALESFSDELDTTPIRPVRLTSPTDVSIYV